MKASSGDLSPMISFIIVCMAVFLNQSNIILGINLSLSDFFSMLLLLFLFITGNLRISKAPILFFLVLTVWTMLTTFFYVPEKFIYYPDKVSVLVNYAKLLVILFYFVLGYNISILELGQKILKWYSIGALVIGLAGSFAAILKVGLLTRIMLDQGVRLKGLMNDPNYFSLIQVSAMIYFYRKIKVMNLKKISIMTVFIIAIIASGSKTGIITLLCCALILLIEAIFKRHTLKSVIAYTSLLLPLVLLAANITAVIQNTVMYLSSALPAFDRIQLVFTDFGSAVSGMGSGRDVTWSVAIGLIQMSPIFGIGLGTYAGIAVKLFNTPVIAHNTYLQLFTEWGIVLPTILFVYIFYMIGKVTINRKAYPGTCIILRDMLIAFLIGSLAISLNNARMFWLFLGMLVSETVNCKGQKVTIHD